MKLTKKDISKIEGLGWSIEKDDWGCYSLENYSPAGGDMVLENIETKEQLIEACENYDAEDEFSVWYNAKNGEPSNPGDLWEDCLAKGEMYTELANALK